MGHFLQNRINWFYSKYQYQFQTYWFKKLLYGFVALKTIYWLGGYQFYFGPKSLIYCAPYHIGSVKDLAFLLYASTDPFQGYVFLIPLLLLSIFRVISSRLYFIPEFLAWFLVININNRLYPTLTGGDYLLNQFLLFSCFLSTSFDQSKSFFSDLKLGLHNLAVLAVIIQVCIVYSLSALAKLTDAEWLTGEAIYDISQVNHFNLFEFAGSGLLSKPILIFLNYLILLYQALFSIVVWVRPIKKPFIVIGLFMHVYIIFVMGIVEFGLIMLLSYIYFWPFKKAGN